MKAARPLSALLLLVALQAPAGGAPLLTDPLKPLDTVTTWALLEVPTLYLYIDQEPLVYRQGQTLRLDVEGFDCGPIVCGTANAFPVELGVLEAGTYSLEAYIAGSFFETFTLEVAAGPKLAVSPALPTPEDSIRLHIEGDFAPCSSAGLELVADNILTVAITSGNCSPGLESAAAGSLELTLPPLDVGEYRVELLSGGQPAAHFLFAVIPPQPRLQNGRFELAASWRNAAGQEGQARLVQTPSNDSALFYFFSPDNWELMVKVLDGCAINGAYWVFAAASTDVEYSVTVEDLLNDGAFFTFGNALGQPAVAVTNLNAFPCS